MVHRQEHKPSHQSHGKEHTLQGSYRRMWRIKKKVGDGEGGEGRKMTFVLQIPHEVARYLELDQPENYTFHSLRRTSASC